MSESYGANPALDAVSFSVEAGRIVGLIGPNGAAIAAALVFAAIRIRRYRDDT